ncbi:hypothetical protein LUZ60_005749 [Juncus effusus]|nr:hypothetical protein LUZ60_005749 [Juncus effusus]
MEGSNVSNGRRTRLNSREASPDRARPNMQQRPNSRVLNAKKVQIVYYLSRNGQLEHPHFMELSQFPNQQIRLKDVIERLTVLRGKGMPSLYSWSCKRSYKNGYVWNDLSENDVIYPSDGAEYVLKGSEVINGCSERFEQLQLSNRFVPKALAISHKAYIQPDEEEEESDERDPLDYRRTSTVNIKHAKPRSNHSRQIELQLDDSSSPPSSSSSDKQPSSAEQCPARPNSVFLQLIACGAGAVSGNSKGSGRKSGGLHRGVVSRLAAGRAGVEEEEFRRVSDNPRRYGGVAVEDKEYFSGSIVEEGLRAGPPEPVLKKSNSYNEERRARLGIGEGITGAEEEEEEKVVRATEGVRGKCIPVRKKNSAKLQPHH